MLFVVDMQSCKISKNSTGFLKRNPMFIKVSLRFSVIPAKHLCIYIISDSL